MFDYRRYDPVPCARPLQVFGLFQQVVDGIVVNKERALAEVRRGLLDDDRNRRCATAKRANVPFRIGHHFASQLTDYGRGKGLKLHEIPYAEAARIYSCRTRPRFR